MKIGQWDTLGRARQLLQHQLGEMGGVEYATHVAVNPDNGRLRILVATDLGLMDYHYAPAAIRPRGHVDRCAASCIAGRASGDCASRPTPRSMSPTTTRQEVWRLVAEDPRIELTAATDNGEAEIEAVLDLARACIQHAG